VFSGSLLLTGRNDSLEVGQFSCLNPILSQTAVESGGHVENMFPCRGIEFSGTRTSVLFDMMVGGLHRRSFNRRRIELRVFEGINGIGGWLPWCGFDRRESWNTAENFLRVKGIKTSARPSTADITYRECLFTGHNKCVKPFDFLNTWNSSSYNPIHFPSHLHFHRTEDSNVEGLCQVGGVRR